MFLGDVFSFSYKKRFLQIIKEFYKKRLNFRSLSYLIFRYYDKQRAWYYSHSMVEGGLEEMS